MPRPRPRKPQMMSPKQSDESSTSLHLSEARRSKQMRHNAIRNYLRFVDAVKAREDVSKREDESNGRGDNNETTDGPTFDGD